VQHLEARIWIVASAAVEGKQVLAAVGVRRKHPVAESNEKIPTSEW
jgi:hypothetical protein